MTGHDVVIIGGGVVGCAIARELSRYTLRVALLEKEEELAFGVSKSNSGIIHPGTQNPPGSLKGCLCVEGNRRIRKVARELGVDFREVGELIVIFHDSERADLERIRKDAVALGVPGVRVVDRAWLRRHEPNLHPEALAALYAPTAGIVSPYRLAYDMSENAARNGAEIHTGTHVIGIAHSLSGPYRFEVSTSRGMFRARSVVNAAGLYADAVAAMAGIADFRIRPRKGEEFILDKKRQYLTKHLIFPLPTPVSKGILVIKTADGNPMIGPTADDTDDREDRATTDAGLEKVLAAARRLVPAIDGNDIIAYFAGLRPVAGDDFIVRRETSVPGMITVAGIQSPGLTSSPAIAVMVAGLLKAGGLRMRRKLFFRARRTRTIHLFEIPLARTKQLIRHDHSYGDIVCRCEMVSAREVREAIRRGARTMDGIKFRTRAQAGRCHGSFCTTRLMKILAEEAGLPVTKVTKRGKGSCLVKEDRHDA